MQDGKDKKQNDVTALLSYAGHYRKQTYLGLVLSAAAMVLGMAPYICIWLAARDLLAAGFPVDADEEMIRNVITLFCEENLAEEQAEDAA